MATLVEFYEKQYGHCPQCVNMRKVLDKWIEDHPQEDVTVITVGIEDELDNIKSQFSDVSSAPLVVITRDNTVTHVSGNNPDILVDLLAGDDEIWEEA